MQLMIWIIAAFACPLLHGIANLIDNYLTDKIFSRISALVFYSAFFNIAFLPIVLLKGWPTLPPLQNFPVFIVIGLIEVLYLFPYFKALQDDDTSVVISLFSLGKIFVPLLAFIAVGEIVSVNQYIGFFIVLLSGSILTMSTEKIFHWKKSFYYMFFASFLLSIQTVMYKYLFNEIGWVDGFFWSILASFFWAMTLLIFKKERTVVIREWSGFWKAAPLFALTEFFTFSGTTAKTFALSIAPVTLVQSIEESQPFFVLLYAIVLKKAFPKYFREKTDAKSIAKKVALFNLMVLGIILIIISS